MQGSNNAPCIVVGKQKQQFYTFVYNFDGLRTEKTVNGVVHTYHYTGTQLFAERWVENGIEHVMVFLYDANGIPLGFKYRNSSYAQGAWDGYWYERNLQGDIVAIYNDSNVKLVSYAYDAWGKVVSTTFANPSSVPDTMPGNFFELIPLFFN